MRLSRFTRKPRKYRNVREGGFDSRKEARTYANLVAQKRARVPADRVIELRRQVRFELIPRQDDERGRCIERAVNFIADFVVLYGDDRREVIDTKSPVTRRLPVYVIKRKLMLHVHGVRVREV